MRQLVRFELYKVFHQKMIYFLSIVLLGYLAICIISNANIGEKTNNNKQYEGVISEEVVAIATSNDQTYLKTTKELGKLPAEVFYRTLENVRITQELENRKKIMETQLPLLKGIEYRKVILEVKILGEIHPPVYYADEGLREVISNSNIIAMFIASSITLGLAGIFSIENTTGVNQFILSAEKGRKEIVTAKVIAAIIFTTSICFAFNFAAFCLIKINYGNLGWESLLQYAYSFQESPYALTMGQYYFMQLGIQLIASIAYCLFILLISSLAKNTLISFVVCGFVYMNFIWMEMDGGVGIAPHILDFTYYGLMKVNDLFVRFEAVNVFEYPFLLPVAALVFTLIVSIVFMKMIYAINRMKYLG
ncbi:MAG: ABC transporter permease subunit [Bacillus sp. (in: firmicutes)]